MATLDSAMEALNAAWTAASEELYKAQQQSGADGQQGQAEHHDQQQGQAADTGGGDDVADADFEEVK
jgi:molecular chaperone DnaK